MYVASKHILRNTRATPTAVHQHFPHPMLDCPVKV